MHDCNDCSGCSWPRELGQRAEIGKVKLTKNVTPLLATAHATATYTSPATTTPVMLSPRTISTPTSPLAASLWAGPAEVSSYIFDESSVVWPKNADSTNTPDPNKMMTTSSLWAAPAEPPSFCSTPPQRSAEYTVSPEPDLHHINNPILGPRNYSNPKPLSPLTFPSLSPTTLTTSPSMDDACVHFPSNNLIVNLPTELTPLHDTFLHHPNLDLT